MIMSGSFYLLAKAAGSKRKQAIRSAKSFYIPVAHRLISLAAATRDFAAYRGVLGADLGCRGRKRGWTIYSHLDDPACDNSRCPADQRQRARAADFYSAAAAPRTPLSCCMASEWAPCNSLASHRRFLPSSGNRLVEAFNAVHPHRRG